jgi:hypothetical protein
MSMATLEREITAEAAKVLNNPKLKKKDIQEWTTGTLKAVGGEVVVTLPTLGIDVAVKIECDKRKSS